MCIASQAVSLVGLETVRKPLWPEVPEVSRMMTLAEVGEGAGPVSYCYTYQFGESSSGRCLKAREESVEYNPQRHPEEFQHLNGTTSKRLQRWGQ